LIDDCLQQLVNLDCLNRGCSHQPVTPRSPDGVAELFPCGGDFQNRQLNFLKIRSSAATTAKCPSRVAGPFQRPGRAKQGRVGLDSPLSQNRPEESAAFRHTPGMRAAVATSFRWTSCRHDVAVRQAEELAMHLCRSTCETSARKWLESRINAHPDAESRLLQSL
jgi:hypothetical protein